MTCPHCSHEPEPEPISPYADDVQVAERLREILCENHVDDHPTLIADLARYVMEAYHAGFAEAYQAGFAEGVGLRRPGSDG